MGCPARRVPLLSPFHRWENRGCKGLSTCPASHHWTRTHARAVWLWNPNNVMVIQKSKGSASLYWKAFSGSTNRPCGHTYDEAHFWQNMDRKLGGWSRGGWRNKEGRKEKEQGRKGSRVHGRRESHSPWKNSDTEYGNGFQLFAPPSTSQNLPSSAQRNPCFRATPACTLSLPTFTISPTHSLWGYSQGCSESWAGIIKPHPR